MIETKMEIWIYGTKYKKGNIIHIAESYLAKDKYVITKVHYSWWKRILNSFGINVKYKIDVEPYAENKD